MDLNLWVFIGIQLLNEVRGDERFISYPHSPVKVMVIPTDEEVMIARDVVRLSKQGITN